MRVVLVTHYFPNHRGGVESVAWEIGSRLATRGDVDIQWYASDTDVPPADRPGLRCVAVGTCNAAERRLGFPFPIWSPAGLAKLVRAVRQCDALHLHDCLYLPNLVAWAAAGWWRRPVIITQHVGRIPFRNPVLRALLAIANRSIGSLLLGRATQAVFVSDVVLDHFARFVRFRNPPVRLSNGVDTEVFRPADEARRKALRAELDLGGRPLLLFVGRFVEKKGLRLLQRLARDLPHARWIFAGWGPLDPSAWGYSNVIVRHDLSREELVPLYQVADLLVLPSVGEGFPLVVQEAMACGTPALINTDTAAACPEAAAFLLSEPVEQGDAVAGWRDRLETLLCTPETLCALRTGVAEFARASWSWERCAEKYAHWLRACTSPR